MYDRIFVRVVGATGQFEMDLGRHETLGVVLERASVALFDAPTDGTFVVTHNETPLPSAALTLAELADEPGWDGRSSCGCCARHLRLDRLIEVATWPAPTTTH